MGKKYFRDISIWLGLGGAVFLLLAFMLHLDGAEGEMRYKILADSATLPAVILLGIGCISLLSRAGLFDIFLYSFSRLSLIFAPLPKREVSYYDFKAHRRDKIDEERSYMPLLAGAIYLLISLALTFMFYLA